MANVQSLLVHQGVCQCKVLINAVCLYRCWSTGGLEAEKKKQLARSSENPQTTAKKKYSGNCKPITAADEISLEALFKTIIWEPDTETQSRLNIFISSWLANTCRIAKTHKHNCDGEDEIIL